MTNHNTIRLKRDKLGAGRKYKKCKRLPGLVDQSTEYKPKYTQNKNNSIKRKYYNVAEITRTVRVHDNKKIE